MAATLGEVEPETVGGSDSAAAQPGALAVERRP